MSNIQGNSKNNDKPEPDVIANHCQFKQYGCSEVFSIKDVEKHESECIYKPEECTFCNLYFCKKDINAHFIICKNEEVSCSECGFLSRRKDFEHSCYLVKFFGLYFSKYIDQKIENSKINMNNQNLNVDEIKNDFMSNIIANNEEIKKLESLMNQNQNDKDFKNPILNLIGQNKQNLESLSLEFQKINENTQKRIKEVDETFQAKIDTQLYEVKSELQKEFKNQFLTFVKEFNMTSNIVNEKAEQFDKNNLLIGNLQQEISNLKIQYKSELDNKMSIVISELELLSNSIKLISDELVPFSTSLKNLEIKIESVSQQNKKDLNSESENLKFELGESFKLNKNELNNFHEKINEIENKLENLYITKNEASLDENSKHVDLATFEEKFNKIKNVTVAELRNNFELFKTEVAKYEIRIEKQNENINKLNDEINSLHNNFNHKFKEQKEEINKDLNKEIDNFSGKIEEFSLFITNQALDKKSILENVENKINSIKNEFIQLVDEKLLDLKKQTSSFQQDINNYSKELNTQLDLIRSNKNEILILMKMIKENKNIDIKDNVDIVVQELNRIQEELRRKVDIIPGLREDIERHRIFVEDKIENMKNELNESFKADVDKSIKYMQNEFLTNINNHSVNEEGIHSKDIQVLRNEYKNNLNLLEKEIYKLNIEIQNLKEEKEKNNFITKKESEGEHFQLRTSTTPRVSAPAKLSVDVYDMGELKKAKKNTVEIESLFHQEDRQSIISPIFQENENIFKEVKEEIVNTKLSLFMTTIMDQLNQEISLKSNMNVFSCLYLESNYLVTGHKDGSINLWDMNTYSVFKTYKEHSNFIDDLKAINRQIFISCSKDYMIKLWDITKNESIKTIANDSWTYSISLLHKFSEDRFATGDEKKNIKFWNFNTGEFMALIPSGHKNGVGRMLHLHNVSSHNLILTSSNPDIKLFDMSTLLCIRTFNEHTDWVNGLIYLKGDLFCTSSADKLIKIWNVYQTASVSTINAHKTYVSCIIYLPAFINNLQEDVILTGSLGKTSKLIDINTGKVLKTLERSESIFKMVHYFHNGNIQIAGCHWGSKEIKIWGKTSVQTGL